MTNKKRVGSELRFFTSFIFLGFSITAIFVLMLVYRPSESSKLNIADNKKPAKTLPRNYREAKNSGARSAQARAESAESFQEHRSPDGEKAEILGSKSDSKGGADVETDLSEAMRLVDAGNPKEAQALLEKILVAHPDHEMALIELGMLHLIDHKDPKRAKDFLEKALKLNPDNRIVMSELVGIYDEAGLGDSGIAYLKGLYDAHPQNSYLALGIGETLINQDRVDEALPFIAKAAENSTDPEIWTTNADALSELGQGEKAVESYQKSLEFEIERRNSGYYDSEPGIADERIALKRMDLISEYLNQKSMDKAEAELTRLREDVKDETKLAAILDKFRLARSVR